MGIFKFKMYPFWCFGRRGGLMMGPSVSTVGISWSSPLGMSLGVHEIGVCLKTPGLIKDE